MAKKKIYAVRNGRTTGIFDTWDACKASVEGYSCAEYKSFLEEKDALEYLAGEQNGQSKSSGPSEEGRLIAYVDGSYDQSIGRYSFGCIMITPEGNVIKESGSGNNEQSLALRNVTGEMLGAMYAVQWAIKNGYQAIDIRYDYLGIEMWATGGWKAKNELTQKYAGFMNEKSQKIHIVFTKIAAHSGNQYNEAADQLAKEALLKENGIKSTVENLKNF